MTMFFTHVVAEAIKQVQTNNLHKSNNNVHWIYLFYYRYTPLSTEDWRLKPSSYFLQMRIWREFDVNLTSQPLCSDICKWVEQSWTAANYSLWICDVNVCIAFAFAGSMNRALGRRTKSSFPLVYYSVFILYLHVWCQYLIDFLEAHPILTSHC